MKLSPSRPVVLYTATASTSKLLRSKSDGLVHFVECPRDFEGVQRNLAESALGIWVRQDSVVGKGVLERFPGLKFVATSTTSTVHIDHLLTAALGIRILHLEPEDTGLQEITSTVDHTWALILHCHGKVEDAIVSVRNGVWRSGEIVRDSQLKSLVLGVVGLGRIGMRVASVGKAFGMHVVGHDPSSSARGAAEASGIEMVNSIEEVFRASNLIALHASSGRENWGLVSKKVLAQAQGVALFNTSRGEIVDEYAVVKALERGNLAGYHTDVAQFENQGVDLADSLLFKAMKRGLNITLTPHVAGASRDAMELAEEIILQKIRATVLALGKENFQNGPSVETTYYGVKDDEEFLL